MSELVQSKRKPPVLAPLANPLKQKPERLAQRIQLITNYAERYRELDESEAREYLNLKHILAHGCERPKGGNHLHSQPPDPADVRKAISALLD